MVCAVTGAQKPKLTGSSRVAVAGDRVPGKVSGDVMLPRSQVPMLVLSF